MGFQTHHHSLSQSLKLRTKTKVVHELQPSPKPIQLLLMGNPKAKHLLVKPWLCFPAWRRIYDGKSSLFYKKKSKIKIWTFSISGVLTNNRTFLTSAVTWGDLYVWSFRFGIYGWTSCVPHLTHKAWKVQCCLVEFTEGFTVWTSCVPNLTHEAWKVSVFWSNL